MLICALPTGRLAPQQWSFRGEPSFGAGPGGLLDAAAAAGAASEADGTAGAAAGAEVAADGASVEAVQQLGAERLADDLAECVC